MKKNNFQNIIRVPVELFNSSNLDFAINFLNEKKGGKTPLEKYASIKDEFDSLNKISAGSEFAKLFNDFYTPRGKQRSQTWQGKYYDLFEKKRNDTNFTFSDILESLKDSVGSVEVVFASKMLHTIHHGEKPIYDSLVSNLLSIKKVTGDAKKRIKYYSKMYDDLEVAYKNFLETYNKANDIIKLFDEKFPNYKDKISPMKKIDFIIWAIGHKK